MATTEVTAETEAEAEIGSEGSGVVSEETKKAETEAEKTAETETELEIGSEVEGSGVVSEETKKAETETEIGSEDGSEIGSEDGSEDGSAEEDDVLVREEEKLEDDQYRLAFIEKLKLMKQAYVKSRKYTSIDPSVIGKIKLQR